MTAPLSNKADPADEDEEITRTLYGVYAADQYMLLREFSARIVKDTILLHRVRGGRSLRLRLAIYGLPGVQALRPLLPNRQ